MAENIPSATETDSTRENRKWHLSWIIASLVAVVVGAILAWSGLDMIPSILIVALGWILATTLLWLMTPARLHTVLKIGASLILLICTLLSVRWIYRFDRPILSPEIGGLITQNYNGNALSIDVETLVKNTGRQSGYADSWRLDLMIDGTTIQGRELYGERLPEPAANEPPISGEEFPPGKPVRGWLSFAFPGVSHDYAATYFTCGSPLMDKVSLRLSVWDSKMKREWSQSRSLKDMGKEACTPLVPLQTPASVEPKDQHSLAPPKKPNLTPAPVAPPPMKLDCEGGNCAQSSGQTGGITAGQIVNQEPITWYDFNGAIHSRRGNTFTAIAGQEMIDFQKMVELEPSNDWKGLKELAETAISKYPNWPTPLAELSIADYHLCDKDGALSNARAFISKATLADQFSNSYDQPLKITQSNLTAMSAGNWPSNCQ